MRRFTLLALLLALTLPGGASVDGEPQLGRPNPYLSFLPAGARPDYDFWRAEMQRRAAERRRFLPKDAAQLAITETEGNDDRATADLIAGFGTGPGEDPGADCSGVFTAGPPPTILGAFAEDDGAIPLANETGLTAGSTVRVSGTIGDGPHGSAGSASGDFDVFRIPGVRLGELILIDVDTAVPFGALDPFIALYDSAGNSIALNEDGDANVSFDSLLAIPAPADDDYFLSIGGSLFPFASLLIDPFDPTSGTGVGSEGDYEITLGLDAGDPDWVSFDLEACDILGANLVGAGRLLALVDPDGTLVVGSSQDLSAAYPGVSPLPGGGTAALAHVATKPGRYALRALGDGGPNYRLELRVFRQPRESSSEPKKVFVDFDGATVDPAIFGQTPGSVTLSPLVAFLPRWGLGPGDEDAVIDSILAALTENLLEDPRARGPNGAFAVELLNSRDHADPFGDPDTSRLIVGGSIGELGLPTIGIAQSIDPGNFEAAETAVILLDLLSGPALDVNSLNGIPRAPDVTIIDLIGVAVGNIAAHEAGHYTGGFHTEQFNSVANLMDQGGNLPNTIGLGPDGIFGNADDVDVDFGADFYVASERFAGLEDTLTIVACGCAITSQVFGDDFESGNADRWSLQTSPEAE